MSRKGLMLVLSAPSGAGKTTLARRLIAEEPESRFSISVTTRAPRKGGVDGVDYRFVSSEQFARMREEGELLEWAQVHGATYGTPADYAAEALEHQRLVVFDIDVQGGLQIKDRHPEAATVLILPPSPEELARRLRGRGTENEGAIERRLEVAREELETSLENYDYLIVNDSLERAYRDLAALVRFLRGEGGEGDERLADSLRLGPHRKERLAELAAWTPAAD